ncbi:MAG: ROK family protein [Peptoniphilus sp.]|nr:ROK family protein [Peptoniphilus sp.]MDY3118738.1 ROK family protein [Peptoniphilus sp.]
MYDVGLDIGGTEMKLGLFDEGGRLLHVRRKPTPKDPNQVVEVIYSMMKDITYGRFGIATAGTVDRQRLALSDLGGNISSWRGFPLGEALKRKGVRVDALENDVNCALVAEMTCRTEEDVLYVGIGTGIGGAFYTGGRLFLGSRGSAMEIGHMIVREGGDPCACGQRGCAEVYYSAKAFYKRMKEAGFDDGDTFLDSGDEKATNYVLGLADYFIGLESVLNPSVIVIGGGMATYAPRITVHVRRAMLERGNDNIRAPIDLAHFRNDGGMIGAVLLAKKEGRTCENHL